MGNNSSNQGKIFLNSVFFVLGFTLVFSVVGVLLQTALAPVAHDTMGILRTVGGSIIMLFGLFLILSLKYRIPFFDKEHKLRVKKFSSSYVTSFVFGLAFAIGWTPCVGAILGSIYALAATSPGTGFLLLFAYSLGLGIPFLLAGAFTSRLSKFISKSQRLLGYFNMIGGLFLVVIGLLVVFNYIGIISTFFLSTNGAAGGTGQLNFAVALIAGIITFVSPCILPLLPAFFSYVAGTSAVELKKK